MTALAESAATAWFDNPAIGQRTRLVTLPSETGGRRAVLEYVFEPYRGENSVPKHFHPHAEERFEILSGTARYRLGDRTGTAFAGDTIVMPPNVPHVHPWSASGEPLVVRQTILVDPPDEEGLTGSIQGAITIFGLARDGKVNAQGVPSLLQMALILRAAMPATFMAGLPPWLQLGLMRSLGWIAERMGYRLAYPRYGILTASGFRAPVS